MFSTLGLHRQKLVLIFGLAMAGLTGSLLVGTPKSWEEIDWLDVIGEGGTAVALSVWMVLILGSRPGGRVTDLLTLGLGFMFLAMWQDNLDEFIRIPAEQIWDQWLESAAMPFGVVLLTYGLVHWHSEQLAINRQLRKREHTFREHRLVDQLTQVGHAGFLKQQLSALCQPENDAPPALIMVDIDRFDHFNRQHGHREGDRLLSELSELLMLNLREQDLVCRYAADRFAVVLPDTSEAEARRLSIELTRAVSAFAYKHKTTGETRYQTISTGVSADQIPADAESFADDLIQSANDDLIQRRRTLSGDSFVEKQDDSPLVVATEARA